MGLVPTASNSQQHQQVVLRFNSILTIIEETTKTHLNITKDVPIIQKIPRVLGAYARNGEQRPIHIFFFLQYHNTAPHLSWQCIYVSTFHSFIWSSVTWFYMAETVLSITNHRLKWAGLFCGFPLKFSVRASRPHHLCVKLQYFQSLSPGFSGSAYL